MKKTRVPKIPSVVSCVIMWSLVLTHYQCVTDRQTDGMDRRTETPLMSTSCSSIAAHDKEVTKQ